MRYLSIFTLLVSAASAATISFSCAPNNQNAVTNAGLVNGGATSVTCNGFTAPAGSIITNVNMQFLGTFQDSFGNGNQQLTFAGSSAFGGFAAASTTSDPNVGFLFTNAISSTPGVNSTGGTFVFSVTTTNTVNGSTLPDNASYTVSGVYTYEVQNQGGVPEPSTLALVGGVLVLAGIRKFKS